ncbi:unnamed protein product [Paramecium sonneborni]|uniref:Tubby C-terminal domain-containing protein n=1 Tax=Paramecium sonneborni TaxID=65129 RepID=A0A8S1M1M7_9CILI|nr:unnamed protein product [Paramecium sonneborni]
MFLNPEMIKEAQDSSSIQNSQLSSRQQNKQRSNNQSRFQAKQKDEPKSNNKPLSRIQQRELEIQKKQIESQIQDNNEMVESIVQFDSDDEQNGANQIINPLILNQQEHEEQIQQQQVMQSKPKIFDSISALQNNTYYKKKLGQNESSYGQDYDFKMDQLTIIGNNHNQYYEPGYQNNLSNDLPQLQKQNNNIQFDYTKKNQEKKYQQNQEEAQIINNLSKYQQLNQNEEFNDIIQIDGNQSEICFVNNDQQDMQNNSKNEKEQQEKFNKDENSFNELIDKQQQIIEKPNEDQQLQQQQQQQQQQDQQQQIQQKQTSPYPKPLASISMPHGNKHFFLNPAQKGGMIQCTIKRDRSGMCRFYPKYHLHISNGFSYLMSAKKRACNNTSNYIISQSREDMEKSENFLGKVRSNFMGTEFVLYDSGLNPEKTKDPQKYRQQLGIVQYESNILGTKGPRKMVVLLPNLNERDQLYEFKPSNSKDGILKEYLNNNKEQIVTYVNRPPQWNAKHKAFVLNFYQRVDKPSVKNFQLIVDQKEDNILLQFGRVGEDLFNLDFQYPITPLQAFQIALTSFDYKIACE